VVTKPELEEDKSSSCVNLRVVLKQAEKGILVVDCDVHKPVITGDSWSAQYVQAGRYPGRAA